MTFYEVLGDLQQHIGERYERQLINLVRPDLDELESEPLDFNDSIPF